MSMLWVGVGSLALTATSMGVQYSGALQPSQPNLAASSAQLSNVEAEMLPIQRQMEALAQTGGSGTIQLPYTEMVQVPSTPRSEGIGGTAADVAEGFATVGLSSLFGGGGTPMKWVPYVASDWQQGGQYYGLTKGGTKLPTTKIVNNKPSTMAVDFTGMGQGDVQSAIAKQNAKSQLALSQKYDPQFIQESLDQEALADPESVAARKEMSDLIQGQINRPANEPVADMLSKQVQDTLDAANNGTLTDMDKQRLSDSVTQALSDRGGSPSAPNMSSFEKPLTSGFAGEQRQAAAAQGAMGLLASGSSPEDIAYRREQQNLGNLSSEVNGKTPQSEFSSLSGAQSGPTPMVTDSPLPVMPGNESGAQGVALQNWQTKMNAANNTVNPWMQGISSLIDVGNIAGNLGWKPLAS